VDVRAVGGQKKVSANVFVEWGGTIAAQVGSFRPAAGRQLGHPGVVCRDG